MQSAHQSKQWPKRAHRHEQRHFWCVFSNFPPLLPVNKTQKAAMCPSFSSSVSRLRGRPSMRTKKNGHNVGEGGNIPKIGICLPYHPSLCLSRFFSKMWHGCGVKTPKKTTAVCCVFGALFPVSIDISTSSATVGGATYQTHLYSARQVPRCLSLQQ